MDVLLISFAICVLGVMVTVLLFAIAMRPKPDEEEPTARTQFVPASGGFFLSDEAEPSTGTQPPTNSILLDLEVHVRSEQEAARSFLEGPNSDSLHAPSDSPLWLKAEEA